MVDALLLVDLLPPALAALALTLLLEAVLRPRIAAPWRRPPATWAVHAGTAGLLFCAVVLLVQRPWFATVIIAALQLVVVQSSNVKVRSLKEPFLCQDFDYYLDAIRHPRLYVPFFGIGLAIAAGLAGLATLVAGFLLEASLVGRHGAAAFLTGIAGLGLAALALLVAGLRHRPACRLEPQHDLNHQGLFCYFWAYGLLTRRPLDVPDGTAAPTPTSEVEEARLANLVVVQSESFFDPRPWAPQVHPEVLAGYDRLGAGALHQGRLQVPAWGANTVRTEAAFLGGLTPEALGIHRFNPYRQLARQAVPNLARSLKALGYRTVCIHPYPAGFYLRDRVMPRLGFDTLLDIEAFDPSDKDGQYIGDLAVAERAGCLLADDDPRPLFLFVITMENHGPLHLERAEAADRRRLLRPDAAQALPEGCDDLVVYLRHLGNADRMSEALARRLTAARRPGLLAWYGDHVPIMAEVYRHLGEPDGLTDYLVWSTQRRPSAPPDAVTRSVETLKDLLIEELLAEAGSATATSRTEDAMAKTRRQEQG